MTWGNECQNVRPFLSSEITTSLCSCFTSLARALELRPHRCDWRLTNACRVCCVPRWSQPMCFPRRSFPTLMRRLGFYLKLMMKKVVFPSSLIVLVNSLCFWMCFDSKRWYKWMWSISQFAAILNVWNQGCSSLVISDTWMCSVCMFFLFVVFSLVKLSNYAIIKNTQEGLLKRYFCVPKRCLIFDKNHLLLHFRWGPGDWVGWRRAAVPSRSYETEHGYESHQNSKGRWFPGPKQIELI